MAHRHGESARRRRRGWEVGRLFEGVTADATDAEPAAIAPGFPVFRID
ncbi:hypothetical protein [Nocardia terpenica]|nr:hypothetical protein [Nocardia terpenica]